MTQKLMNFTVNYKSSSDPVTIVAHGIEVVVDEKNKIYLVIEERSFSDGDNMHGSVTHGFVDASKAFAVAGALHISLDELMDTCLDVITNEGEK